MNEFSELFQCLTGGKHLTSEELYAEHQDLRENQDNDPTALSFL